ncbi:MAG TPA: hypothetical protein VEK08_02780 [Planctomycetota bacterium]|nr:hypothetical protein [Planctomycetota bacterium]
MIRSTPIALSLWVLASAVLAAETAEFTVDCSKTAGAIRPLHGGNCGPLQYGDLVDLSAYHREIRIPFTRLHDCHWPTPDVVDIHTIFPNFEADPEKPESYDFRRTDEYIQSVLGTGSKIVYRLGESIEHTQKKYHVHPPKDAAKWAAICCGIIRHYNEGWANGFRHGIQYWEIWNEPENQPAMWTGSDDDYFMLYETAAKTIKSRWPDLKVGGPSLGHSLDKKDGRFVPGKFFKAFLARIKERGLPIDFFSWHLYTDDPAECVARSKAVREILDEHGLQKAESHFNEWNYLPGKDWTPFTRRGQGELRERCLAEIGGAPGAAFDAAVLINLQDSPVDVANFYKNDNHGFAMFSPNGVPLKNFYAFKAFSMLLDTLRVEATGATASRAGILAGMNAARTELRILVSNFQERASIRLSTKNLPWDRARFELYLLDSAHNLERVREGLWDGGVNLSELFRPPSVTVLVITPR